MDDGGARFSFVSNGGRREKGIRSGERGSTAFRLISPVDSFSRRTRRTVWILCLHPIDYFLLFFFFG